MYKILCEHLTLFSTTFVKQILTIFVFGPSSDIDVGELLRILFEQIYHTWHRIYIRYYIAYLFSSFRMVTSLANRSAFVFEQVENIEY